MKLKRNEANGIRQPSLLISSGQIQLAVWPIKWRNLITKVSAGLCAWASVQRWTDDDDTKMTGAEKIQIQSNKYNIPFHSIYN